MKCEYCLSNIGFLKSYEECKKCNDPICKNCYNKSYCNYCKNYFCKKHKDKSIHECAGLENLGSSGIDEDEEDDDEDETMELEEDDENSETYSMTMACSNCASEVNFDIPIGVSVKIYFEKLKLKDSEDYICDDCGCKEGWEKKNFI